MDPGLALVGEWDVVVCGGTLGIFIATALAVNHGLRVAVLERAPKLRGKHCHLCVLHRDTPRGAFLLTFIRLLFVVCFFFLAFTFLVDQSMIHAPPDTPCAPLPTVGPVPGRAQEWNLSMKELRELVSLGVLGAEDLDGAVDLSEGSLIERCPDPDTLVATHFKTIRAGYNNAEVTPMTLSMTSAMKNRHHAAMKPMRGCEKSMKRTPCLNGSQGAWLMLTGGRLGLLAALAPLSPEWHRTVGACVRGARVSRSCGWKAS